MVGYFVRHIIICVIFWLACLMFIFSSTVFAKEPQVQFVDPIGYDFKNINEYVFENAYIVDMEEANVMEKALGIFYDVITVTKTNIYLYNRQINKTEILPNNGQYQVFLFE